MPDKETAFHETAGPEQATGQAAGADVQAHDTPIRETATATRIRTRIRTQRIRPYPTSRWTRMSRSGTSRSTSCLPARAGACSGRAGIPSSWCCSACC